MNEITQRTSKRQSLEVDLFHLNRLSQLNAMRSIAAGRKILDHAVKGVSVL